MTQKDNMRRDLIARLEKLEKQVFGKAKTPAKKPIPVAAIDSAKLVARPFQTSRKKLKVVEVEQDPTGDKWVTVEIYLEVVMGDGTRLVVDEGSLYRGRVKQ